MVLNQLSSVLHRELMMFAADIILLNGLEACCELEACYYDGQCLAPGMQLCVMPEFYAWVSATGYVGALALNLRLCNRDIRSLLHADQ